MLVVALVGWSATALRSPAILALAGLALLSALSAAWTIASVDDALRWGAVIGGLALIAVAASIVSARVGPVPIAAVIAVLAAGPGSWASTGRGRGSSLSHRDSVGSGAPAGRSSTRPPSR